MIESNRQTPRPTVLVVGATGYLGRHIVAALRQAGYPVRALARDPNRLGFAREAGIEVFTGQATRPETLTGLCDGVDVVISALGVRSLKRAPTPLEVDYQANVNILRLAEGAGVRRFLFAGVLHAERMQDSVAVLEPRERFINALLGSPIPATILRAPGFFNDMEILFHQAERGRVYLFGDGAARINPIHPADLAAAFVRHIASEHGAMPGGEPGGDVVEEVGGPDTFSYHDIAALAFRALNKPPHITHLAPGLIQAASWAASPFNPTAAGFLAFFRAVMTTDMVAPGAGSIHLADDFARLARADRARPTAPALA